ncbi:hypothetical protein [[Scytonema hofmanni] UTEX B 1581]|nr:hypothetical protein [[Scytonema hofmanni] UTEX B 1581]
MQLRDRATRLPYCFFCFADSDSTTQSSKTFWEASLLCNQVDKRSR